MAIAIQRGNAASVMGTFAPGTMYPAGKHPLYPYTEEEKRQMLEVLGLKESQILSDVDTILDWFLKQPHLAEAGIYKRTIELFVFLNQGSVEKVKQGIDRYYKHRYNSPEIIQDRISLLNDTDRPVWETFAIVPMPKLYQGCRVTITKLLKPEAFPIELVLITAYMLADIRFANDFMLGDIWVLDSKDFTISHALKVNLMALKKAVSMTSDGMPLKIKAIHVINCNVSTLGQFAINLLKTVVKQKILDRVQFHETIEDLYNHVPKEYLPKDLNGDMPSISDVKEQLETLVKSEKTKQLLLDCCKQVSNEARRPKEDNNNEDYLPGNFRKLELD